MADIADLVERAEAGGGAQPALLRELNERVVLDAIRELRPISRADVARRTGLSKPTVSLALRTLETSGLVHAVGVQEGRPGRAGLLFEPVTDVALAAGIEIGVRHVRGALADLDGLVVAELAVPNGATLDAIHRAVRDCLTSLCRAVRRPRRDIAAVAIGMPGVIDPSTGVLTRAGTLPALDGSMPERELSAMLGLPTTVRNDVDLAALGEQADGPGRDVDDAALVWVGSGLGAALIVDGELRVGHRGGAGEIFDVPFAPVAAAAGGGADPTEVSRSGVSAMAAALAAEHHSTVLRPPFAADEVLDAAQDDDPLGLAVRDRLAQWVAWYAAAIAAVVDPEVVILSGPLGSHDTLEGPVRDRLAELLDAPPRVASSKLGDRAVLAGALSVARAEALDRVFAARELHRG